MEGSEFRESIVQEDSLGCAVASTAFVLGISYQEALALFTDGERRSQEISNFYCPEITSILKEKGLDYSWSKLTNDNKRLAERELAIVFCEQSLQLPFGHFLARHKNKWMDPWINLPEPQRAAGFREELPGKPTYVIYPKRQF